MKLRGEIAVFLALLLSVLSAFVVALAANVRKQLEKGEAIMATDAAIRSCFAEYNKVFYEKYHIYLIDTSYKEENGGPDKLKKHFEVYMQSNMADVMLCETEIFDKEDAYYNSSEYLYNMAVNYALDENILDKRVDRGNDEENRFVSYLESVCGNYEDYDNDELRIGEIEYLLYGFSEDGDNIRYATEDFRQYCESAFMTEDEGELSYEDYLISRLSEEGILSLRRRFGELVTEYMRQNGSPGFALEKCYGRFSVYAAVKGKNNKEYTITRDYGYEYCDTRKEQD